MVTRVRIAQNVESSALLLLFLNLAKGVRQALSQVVNPCVCFR